MTSQRNKNLIFEYDFDKLFSINNWFISEGKAIFTF